MTKAEFTSKMGKLSYCDDLGRLALFSEYVESLEAENERLTKAVEKAVATLRSEHNTDSPCPHYIAGYWIDSCRDCVFHNERHQQEVCWRQYLMGDE